MRKKTILAALFAALLLCVSLCGTAQAEDVPQIPGLTFLEETPLVYAQGFQIYRYEGGYSLICINEIGRYLVVPEDGTAPKGLDADIRVLQQPVDRIYLAATSAMALFDAVDALDHIRLTGTQASGWYIESAAQAMENGSILFAGKYSEPDYEMLLLEDCCLAIENTMIFHTPKVMEMIEDLGIPVLIDRSSYETHPLGRTEWIKLYAVLTGKEAEAEAFFNQQTGVITELEDNPNSGKKVAFFYVNSDGSVVVRNPRDYIPQMIELGGAKYVCPALSEDDTGTTVAVTMESFYAIAWDADYLIYNASIDGTLDSIDQLISKDSLFADFTAVQQGNVWCSGKSFYQATDIVGQMILDVHKMITEQDESGMTFLSRVR